MSAEAFSSATVAEKETNLDESSFFFFFLPIIMSIMWIYVASLAGHLV